MAEGVAAGGAIGPGPGSEPTAVEAGVAPGVVEVASLVDNQTGYVDVDRAAFEAGAAERAEFEHVLGGVEVGLEQRGQGGADGAGVDGAVGVAADFAVDGAGVEAGATAEAGEQVAVGASEDVAAAVVEDDQVELFGTVGFVGAGRAGDDVGVDGDTAADGGADGELEQQGEVGEGGDDFFHAHQGDADARSGGGESAVAFVGEHDERAGLGDGEVDADDAQVGSAELVAEVGAGGSDELGGVVGVADAEFLLEESADLLAALVDHGGDDVAGVVVVELEDEFAHVGFVSFEAGAT